MRAWIGLTVVLMACGGSPRRNRTIGPPGVDALMADADFRLVWPWTELQLDERGARFSEHLMRGGQCLAIVVGDPGVTIEAGGATGMSVEWASWLVGCMPHDGPVQVTLRGPPSARVAVGMFVGPPETNAHQRLAEHFQVATDEEPVSTTLQVQENACDEDTARDHYRRGMELVRAEKLAEASEALALAYACHADGTILFNLATVTAQRGRENEARHMYHQLLRDHAPLPDALQAEVEGALDRLLSPGTLRVVVQRDDVLFVNGVRVRYTGELAELEAIPGQHVVILRTAAGARHELNVQLRSNQELEIDPRQNVATADSTE